MALTNCYVNVYGQISELFEKIKQGQAPDKFSIQHLKDIGFNSTNHRALIPLLKALGFLSADGSPTKRYHDYRNNANSRKVMGESLKEAYSDIFTISAKPSKTDISLIQGKFKSTHNSTDRNAELMTKTFFSLLDLADIDHKKEIKPKIDDGEENPEKVKTEKVIENLIKPTLHYNIQIHLPPTKDVEVYNAIIKSIKEHLID